MKKLLAILVLLLFATPAMAQNWNFYGSVRTHLGYYDIDDDFGLAGPAMDNALVPGESGILLMQSGQARFGAFSRPTDNLTGRVEFGLRETGASEVYLRLIYADWNFGAGNLIVGQDYTPATYLGYSGMIGDIGAQGDVNLLAHGLLYTGRQPQLKLRMGDFDIALISRERHPNVANGEDFIPKIEASYVVRTPMGNIRAVGGWQRYDDAALDTTIDAFVVGLGASIDLSPAYLKATVSYQQNAGNYRNPNLVAYAARTATADDDAESYQGTLVAGFNINDRMTAEAGFAYTYNEVGDLEQDGMLYYAQLPIRLDRGFTFTPEFGYISRGDIEFDGDTIAPHGDMWYFTTHFRVDF